MKKALALTLIVCFMLGVSAIGFADQGDVAAISPFSDVSKNHWAYSAIEQLQKDGIIQGDAGMFKGDRSITRYEAAMMIANAMKELRSEMGIANSSAKQGQSTATNVSKQDRALVQKLAAEFAAELDAMGIKVDAMGSDLARIEKKIDRMPKVNWAAQIQVDPQVVPQWNVDNHTWGNTTNPNTLLWLSPMVTGTIDGNWGYYAEIRMNAPLMNGNGVDPAGEQCGNTDYKNLVSVDLRNAYAYGNMIGAKWYVGRMEDNLPFTNVAGHGGLITDSRMDGVRVAMQTGNLKADIFGGFDIAGYGQYVGTFTGGAYETQMPVGTTAMISGMDLGYAITPAANAYFGFYQGWGQNNALQNNYDPFAGVNNPQLFYELGADYMLTPKIQLTAFAASSGDANAVFGQEHPDNFAEGQNLSWLARLDYGKYNSQQQGSMNFYAMYARTGANSVWSQPNYDVGSLTFTKSNVMSSNQYTMLGNAQGFEVGMDWAPIQNIDWHLSWSNTTPIDVDLATIQAYAASGLWTDSFNSQRNIFKSELTFMF